MNEVKRMSLEGVSVLILPHPLITSLKRVPYEDQGIQSLVTIFGSWLRLPDEEYSTPSGWASY